MSLIYPETYHPLINRDPEQGLSYFLRSGDRLRRIRFGGEPFRVAIDLPVGPVGPEWRLNGAWDFNGDGIPDLFGQHGVTGELRIWYGNRRGEYGGDVPFGPIGASWELQLARLTRFSGGVDIFGHNRHPDPGSPEYQAIRVWRMRGGEFVRQDLLGRIGLEWDLHLGDLNGDGIVDIMGIRNNVNPAEIHAWYLGEGPDGLLSITSHGSLLKTIGTEWRLQVRDMDRDGCADVFGYTAQNDLWVWYNVPADGGHRRLNEGKSYGKLGTEWQRLRLGDLNGDGFPDLLGQGADGALHCWLTTGRGITDQSALLPERGWTPDPGPHRLMR